MKTFPAAGLAAVLLASCPCTAAPAAPRSAAAEAARQEVAAAFQRLEAMAHRTRITAPGEIVLMEHVPPNSDHATTRRQDPPGGTEVIRVGTSLRGRSFGPDGQGPWRCADGDANPLAAQIRTMIQKLVRMTAVVRGPDVTLDGEPVHVYTMIYAIQGAQGAAAHMTSTLYVGIKSGLPRRLVSPYEGGREAVTDYYDYGAPISISLPACS